MSKKQIKIVETCIASPCMWSVILGLLPFELMIKNLLLREVKSARPGHVVIF